MKWGINIQLEEPYVENAYKFFETCAAADLKTVRLYIPESFTDYDKVIKLMTKLEMKAYITLYRAEKPSPAEPMYLKFKSSVDAMCRRYHEVAQKFPMDLVIGIGLPEGVHMITKSTARAKFGLRRGEIAKALVCMAEEIKKFGHKVVMPCRIDDVQGDTWRNLPVDVYDIETMMSARMMSRMSVAEARKTIEAAGKPYWFGKLGMLGGYVLPAAQAKFIRRIQEYARLADYSFLWSDPGSDKYSWSVDGHFIVDIHQGTLRRLNRPQTNTGDPVLSDWKRQRRDAYTPPSVERARANKKTNTSAKRERVKARVGK
jgi:hypothetical protein